MSKFGRIQITEQTLMFHVFLYSSEYQGHTTVTTIIHIVRGHANQYQYHLDILRSYYFAAYHAKLIT